MISRNYEVLVVDPSPGALIAAALLARQSGCGDYDDLTRCLRAAREDVAAAWHGVFGEKLEMD